MKQVIQNMKTGITSIQDVAVPAVRPGMILIKTAASMVSAGTEKTVVEFAERAWLIRHVHALTLSGR